MYPPKVCGVSVEKCYPGTAIFIRRQRTYTYRMSETILVPIDGSEPAWAAFQYAIETLDVERLHILYVASGPTNHPYHGDGSIINDDIFDEERDFAAALFEKASQQSGAVPIETKILVGRPAENIVTYAKEADCGHIVMGSTGRDGARRLLLGSVAETVVRRAPVPVTVIR